MVRVLNKKRGLQLVVLYVEMDGWRAPWGFRLWRGKGSASCGALALKLLGALPREVAARHEVMVLADSGFCGAEFPRGVRRLGHHAVVGVRRGRLLSDGGGWSREAGGAGARRRGRGWKGSRTFPCTSPPTGSSVTANGSGAPCLLIGGAFVGRF